MITDIVTLGGALLDKLIPDPQARETAKRDLARLQQNGALCELEIRMSAILAEAGSADAWTSRARPSFLYVFYGVILCMTVLAPLAGVIAPEAVSAFYAHVGEGFNAIPEAMWHTFTLGYLGYTGARSYDKRKFKQGLPWKR